MSRSTSANMTPAARASIAVSNQIRVVPDSPVDTVAGQRLLISVSWFMSSMSFSVAPAPDRCRIHYNGRNNVPLAGCFGND